jgi:hypothetical protein
MGGSDECLAPAGYKRCLGHIRKRVRLSCRGADAFGVYIKIARGVDPWGTLATVFA